MNCLVPLLMTLTLTLGAEDLTPSDSSTHYAYGTVYGHSAGPYGHAAGGYHHRNENKIF